MRLLLSLLLAGCLWSTSTTAQQEEEQQEQEPNCDPCIYRGGLNIRAIYHGQRIDPFWQQVEAAAVQAAADMRVNLDVTLYDEFDPQQMAKDIAAAIRSKPDALIVSMPNQVVEDAVQKAIDAGIPVFGVNSGYPNSQAMGVKAHVAQNDYEAGVAAAQAFIDITGGDIRNAIFINHEKGNTGIDVRLQGFRETMQGIDVDVKELIIDGSLNDQVLVEDIRPIFTGCLYDIVQLANARTVDLALAGFDGLFADCSGRSLIGTFDVSRNTYTGIASNKIAFGVFQQQYLQGAVPVILATQYLTLGILPDIPENEFGIYKVGPRVLTRDKVPSDTIQICTDDAFPTCPKENKLDGSGEKSDCPCSARETIELGAVLGIEDQYSSTLFQGVQQAATDFGITLQLESFDDFATLSSSLLHQEMAARITTMCNKNIDGVVVRLPPDSSALLDAVEWCRKLAVPIIAIQEGNTDLVEQMELMTFIGVDAYKAGYQAGQKLLDLGSVEAWCIVDGEYTTTLTTIDATDTTNATTTLTTSLTLNATSTHAQRCQGMEKAFEENFFVEYMGTIIIPPMKHDNDVAEDIDIQQLLEAQFESDDWEGVGLVVSTSQASYIPLVLQALEMETHPDAMVATFGSSQEILGLNTNHNIVFVVDDQAYLQGYLPIPLLAYQAYTQLALLNPNFQTGPKIIQEVSPAAAFCHDNQYEICAVDDPRIAEILARQKGEEEEEEPVNALAIGLGVAAGIVFCCGCLYVIGKHTLAQQLENEGKEKGGEEKEEGGKAEEETAP